MSVTLEKGKRYLYTRPHATALFIFLGHAQNGDLLFFITRRDGISSSCAVSWELYKDAFEDYLIQTASDERVAGDLFTHIKETVRE